MATEPQTCAIGILPTRNPQLPTQPMSHLTIHKHRESSYLRAYKAPLHLSRVLYKFTPFYAKQTQFTKGQNERKFFYNKGL